MPSNKKYTLDIRCAFEIGKFLKPMYDHKGRMVAFKCPDGSVVRPAVCIELESARSKDGRLQYSYLTSSTTMSMVGCNLTEYTHAEFREENPLDSSMDRYIKNVKKTPRGSKKKSH
jgi:hypothetical protein